MKPFPILINHRHYSHYLPLEEEFDFNHDQNYLFELSHLGCLTLTGERNKDFLQGQLSCDMKEVNLKQMRPAALCNVKGRILALINVLEWQGLHLILPHDLLSTTQQTLSKPAMLSRVTITPQTNYQFYGFYLNNNNDLLPPLPKLNTTQYGLVDNENGCSYYLGNNFYVIITSEEAKEDLVKPFIQKKKLRGALAWHYLQLGQKEIQIYPETKGIFLPHPLELHQRGYINFNKGCYRGQEIIARMHYRGKLKYVLRLFTIQAKTILLAGEKIFASPKENAIGELIDFVPVSSDRYLVALSILLTHPNSVWLEGEEDKTILNPVA